MELRSSFPLRRDVPVKMEFFIAVEVTFARRSVPFRASPSLPRRISPGNSCMNERDDLSPGISFIRVPLSNWCPAIALRIERDKYSELELTDKSKFDRIADDIDGVLNI